MRRRHLKAREHRDFDGTKRNVRRSLLPIRQRAPISPARPSAVRTLWGPRWSEHRQRRTGRTSGFRWRVLMPRKTGAGVDPDQSIAIAPEPV